MQPAPCALRARPLLREDPALHALLAGLRVPAGGDLLLHLCPHPRERRAVPEATSGRLLQGNNNKACDRSSQISAPWGRGVRGHRVAGSQHRAGHAPAPRPLPQPRPHPPPPPVALTPPALLGGGVSLLQSWGFLDFVPPKPSKQPTPRRGLWGGRLHPSSVPRLSCSTCRSPERPGRGAGAQDVPIPEMPRAGVQLEEERLAGRALLRRPRCCWSDARLHPGLIGTSWWSGLCAPMKWAFAYGRLPETPAGGTLPGGLSPWGGGPPPRLARSQRPHGESEDPVGSGPAGCGPGQHPRVGPPLHWQGWTLSPGAPHASGPGAGRPRGKAPRSGEADLSSVKTPLWAVYSSYFCICVSD